MSQVKFVVERVGREIKLTVCNDADSARAFERLWTGIGFCEWGKANIARPTKKTIVSDSYSSPIVRPSWGKYELALGTLYNALTNPSDQVDIIECNSLLRAEKVFHDIVRILDNVMRQIAVAVRDLSQVSDETRTITVDF